MTVGELKAALAKYPDDLTIRVGCRNYIAEAQRVYATEMSRTNEPILLIDSEAV